MSFPLYPATVEPEPTGSGALSRDVPAGTVLEGILAPPLRPDEAALAVFALLRSGGTAGTWVSVASVDVPLEELYGALLLHAERFEQALYASWTAAPAPALRVPDDQLVPIDRLVPGLSLEAIDLSGPITGAVVLLKIIDDDALTCWVSFPYGDVTDEEAVGGLRIQARLLRSDYLVTGRTVPPGDDGPIGYSA